MPLHSTAPDSQCHSISVPVWTAAWYACLDIPINGNGNNNNDDDDNNNNNYNNKK